MIKKLSKFLRNLGLDSELIGDNDNIESIEHKALTENRVIISRNK